MQSLWTQTNCEYQGNYTDIDGNVYPTVKIGNQVWLAENLRVEHYTDNTPIPQTYYEPIPNITDNTAWANLTTPAYCWYNNDIGNKYPYGALYNGYAVLTGRLAPTGWHIPTQAEIDTLLAYIGNGASIPVAGTRLSETGNSHWNNTGGTDLYGFKMVGAGIRSSTTGAFNSIKFTSYISSISNSSVGDFWGNNGSTIQFNSTTNSKAGRPVRCIRDNLTGYQAGETVTDVDGNLYHTVQIGTQVWMVENLKVTRYNDEVPIGNVKWANLGVVSSITNSSSLITTPAYCWYNNDINYKTPYGALYNGYAVRTGLLAPTGTRIPNKEDFDILIAYLGGGTVAGGKLKETGLTYWNSPNTEATDDYDFSAVGAGYLYETNSFIRLKNQLLLWTSSISTTSTNNYYYPLNQDSAAIFSASFSISAYFSVRCLLNNPESWVNGMTITDLDGNVYNTIKIGTQVWLKENLKTTKFSNGLDVPMEGTDAMCWYNGDRTTNIANKHGGLYNGYAGKSAKLCSAPWRVPTDNDFEILKSTMGGSTVAGGNLKQIGFINWDSPNTGATNSKCFSLLGAGTRGGNGVYDSKKIGTVLFATTSPYGQGMGVYNTQANAWITALNMKAGFSIRLVRDFSPNQPPTVFIYPIDDFRLPQNSIGMAASATDLDGTIQGVQWTIVSQPNGSNAQFLNPNVLTGVTLNNLIAGSYTVRVQVEDNTGAIGDATETFTVLPQQFLLEFENRLESWNLTTELNIVKTGGAVVYWGDGTHTDIPANSNSPVTKVYSTAGTYNMSIDLLDNTNTYQFISGKNGFYFNTSILGGRCTRVEITGINSIYGDLSGLHPNITYIGVQGNTAIATTTSILHNYTLLQTIILDGVNTSSGDINLIPTTTTFIIIAGSSALSGDLAAFFTTHSNVTYFTVKGNSTVYGTLTTIPGYDFNLNTSGAIICNFNTLSFANINYFTLTCANNNTVVSGDFVKLFDGNLKYVYLNCNCNGITYSINVSNPVQLNLVKIVPLATAYDRLNSSEVDRLINHLATRTWSGSKTWHAPSNAYKYIIDLSGNNARTSASDAAVATLTTKDVVIIQ